jgi:gamma-glutamylcyclotransferase (GGCT)/AIG2-like uncharacterized protein YtfP
MEVLFVYGTLQYPAVQQIIFGRVIPGTPDLLDGFHKSEIHLPGGSYPIAMRQPGACIAGQALHITPQEMDSSDRYEGSAYVRVRVMLRSGTPAWVYCAPA